MINIESNKLEEAFDKTPIELIKLVDEMQLDQKIDGSCFKHEIESTVSDSIKYIANIFVLGLISEEELIAEIEEELQENKNKSIFAKDILNVSKNILSEFKKREQEQKDKDNRLDKDFEDISFSLAIAASASDWRGSLLKICKENNLNIEQTAKIEEITKKTIRGEIKNTEYQELLKSEAQIEESKAQSITKRVSDEILSIILEVMKENSAEETVIKTDDSEKLLGLDSDIPKPPYDKKNLLEEKEITEEDLSVKKTPSSHGEIDQGSKLDPYREQI